jgi:toxin ParE1/3/4
MRPADFRYSERADADISEILLETERRFGPRQQSSYAGLIDKAAGMVGENPDRAGSQSRPDLGAGIRSFPIRLAAGRRGAAAHTLYYRIDPAEQRVLILRLLHDRMEPARHLTEDLT